MDICDYIQCLEGNALPEDLLRVTIRFMLIALDYLHSANVVHTGEPLTPNLPALSLSH